VNNGPLSPAVNSGGDDMDDEQISVWQAPAPLRERASCLVVRRLAGAAGHQAVHATVHANAHACLNVVVAGSVRCGDIPLPGSFVCGPLTSALATVAAGELLSASLVFQPWLLPVLAGIEPADAADHILPVAGAPALPLAVLRDACGQACMDAGAVDRLWSCLAHLCDAIAAPALGQGTLLASGVAAAAREAGCSERQYQRRFRSAFGLSPATWRRLVRWEHAVSGVMGGSALAEVASAFGYADQAHLTRETRHVAGVPPGRLRNAAAKEGAPWSLRPAHGRSGRP
jgi:AraC-like DNA-binding protein